jgi:hypothetical protein
MADDIEPALVAEEFAAFCEAVNGAASPPSSLQVQQQVRSLPIRLPRPPVLTPPETILANCIGELTAPERTQLAQLIAKMRRAIRR